MSIGGASSMIPGQLGRLQGIPVFVDEKFPMEKPNKFDQALKAIQEKETRKQMQKMASQQKVHPFTGFAKWNKSSAKDRLVKFKTDFQKLSLFFKGGTK